MTTDDTRPLSADLPITVVVDENGNYWRAYDGFYSMCPVSTDNDPVRVAAIYVRLSHEEAAKRARHAALVEAARRMLDHHDNLVAVTNGPALNCAEATALRAALAPTPDPLLDVLDEAEDFNERSHQGQFYVGWRRAIAHLRAALDGEPQR